MGDVTWNSERENIVYPRGFDDGLAAMRERIKGLLIENDRLRKPILAGTHPPVVTRDHVDSRIAFVFGGELTRHEVPGGNGGGRA